MRRTLALIALVVAFAGAVFFGFSTISSVAAKSTPTPTRTPRTTPTPSPTPKPVTPAPSTRPGVMVTECRAPNANAVRAIFLWGPSGAGPQWLDLSIFNNGFAPDTFIHSEALSPNRWGLVWDGLVQDRTHYVRINTLTSVGWMASETFAFHTPVCDPNATPQPGADMLRLRDQLGGAIWNSGYSAAVAITDLRTGETIDVNGNDYRLPGCTINLFALALVTSDLQYGRYPEPEPGDLISQTIWGSNPITARSLVKYWLGGGDIGRGMTRVNEFMRSLGMNATTLDHPPAFPQESLYGQPNNWTTALDMNRGLKGLWDGQVLTPGWRDYLLGKMQSVKPGLNYLIPAGVGYGAKVSHKNGFLYAEGWADNDIGIVWFERDGQRYGYAISFFTQYVPYKYADIALGQRVSSLAYQWFVGRYGYP